MGILKSITLIQCAVIMAMVAGCVPGDESIMRPKAHGRFEWTTLLFSATLNRAKTCGSFG